MGLITHGAILQNEVKGWPPKVLIGAGFDLVANAQWFANVGTPSTSATAVPSSGEAGLDAKFTEVIKTVTDAVDEGWRQRYTYADEPRIKSGESISALIWVATTDASDVTVKLINSSAEETAGVQVDTSGDWQLFLVEDHLCAGTYVDIQITKDATGTFYAGGPITVCIGTNAISLPPRGLVFRWRDPTQIEDWGAATVTVAFADEDVSAVTSNLAVIAKCVTNLVGNSGSFAYHVRRNGSAEAFGLGTRRARVTLSTTTDVAVGEFDVLLDDAQIFEHGLEEVVSGTMGSGATHLTGWWEWE